MIQIKDITNSIYNSKTYILTKAGEDKAWLVDIGDIEPVVSYLKDNGLHAEGVFLTHAHFDHIYGILDLLERYPDCKVYVTEYAKEGLASEKLNMSKYHETPISYKGDNVIVVHEGDEMTLFQEEPRMHFYETPGHNPGCLTMVIGNAIFTGDAFIPGLGANTKIYHADKELAKKSLDRIMEMAKGKKVLSGNSIYA